MKSRLKMLFGSWKELLKIFIVESKVSWVEMNNENV